MENLVAAALGFVLLHRLVSGSSLRAVIVGIIGELAYGRLFQLATVASLVWLCVAYANAVSPLALQLLWDRSSLWNYSQLIVQPVALFCIICGFVTSNPGTFRQEHVADQNDIAQGILRVTRHPFLWGIAIFAVGHFMALPTLRNLILFGTLLFVALTGTISIDAKRSRSLGAKWAAFTAQTSNLPFGAIAKGYQRLQVAELGYGKIAAALIVSFALTFAHPILFGSSVLP